MLGIIIGAALVVLAVLLVCLWALKCYRDFERRMDLVRHINSGYPPLPEPDWDKWEKEPHVKTRKEYNKC
jgi:hypothetical protein